jgi:Pyruvate/2-oxoacid:ferredoxin oxidoreductase delta subunit
LIWRDGQGEEKDILNQGGTMSFKRSTFYVMSGTGNTFRFAHWMRKAGEAIGVASEVVMIDDARFDLQEEKESHHLVGVLFPAHGLMAPWSMIKFLFRIPRGFGTSAICGATRGGIRLWSLTIPGAVGLGIFLAAFILFVKGYRIRGIFSVDMPINSINLHWGMRPENVSPILGKARHKAENIANRVLKGESIFLTLNNLWELGWTLLMLWLLPLYPILYILYGRIGMGKLMFSSNSCVGCGLCARYCPSNGVIMKRVGNTIRPYWTYHCEVCLRCMGFCKKRAVEAGHSWMIILYFVSSIPFINWIISYLNQFLPFLGAIRYSRLGFLFYFANFFIATIIAYWLFWYLVRLPIINDLFASTSLTHYFRRYHEPSTRLRDLRRSHGTRS